MGGGGLQRHRQRQRRQPFSLGPCCVLLLVFVQCCRALVRDEVGIIDWHKRNIGRVSRVVTATEGAKIFVATDRSVVARLQPGSGDIAWRHVMGGGREKVDALLSVKKHLVSVSAEGRFVRLWNARDGNLLWETALATPLLPLGGHISLSASSDDSDVFVLCSNQIHVLRATSGSQSWVYNADPKLENALASSVGRDASVVPTDILTTQGPGAGVFVAAYTTKGSSGKSDSLLLLRFPAVAPRSPELSSMKVGKVGGGGLDSSQGVALLVHPNPEALAPLIVGLGAGGKSLVVMEVPEAGAAADLSELELPADFVGADAESRVIFLKAVGASGGRLMHLRNAAGVQALFAVELGGEGGKLGPLRLREVIRCEGDCALGASLDKTDDDNHDKALSVCKVQRESPDQVSVLMVLLEEGGGSEGRVDGRSAEGVVMVAHSLEQRGELLQAFPVAHQGAVLVVCADDSAVLLQASGAGGGAPVWEREESLSSVLSVDFVNLAVDELLALAKRSGKEEHAIPDLAERLEMQKAEVLRTAKGAVRRVTGGLLLGEEEVSGIGGSQLPTLDDAASSFGFKKLAVCVTASGKVVGVNMDGGGVVWARRLPENIRGRSVQVFSTRPSAIQGYEPEFALVVSAEGSEGGGSGHGLIVWCDGLTGAEKESLEVVGGIERVVPLDLQDGEDRQVLLVVNRQGEVTLAPATPETYAQLATLAGRGAGSPGGGKAGKGLFYHRLTLAGRAQDLLTLSDDDEDDAGSRQQPFSQLTTYTVALSEEGEEEASGPPFRAFPVGSLALPSSEVVVATAYPSRKEVVQTPAHVLGDASLLLKYLNPHLMLLATLDSARPAADTFSAGGGKVGHRLSILLVDNVSARVLHRVQHEHAGGPVHAVLSENWAVYTYWNVKANRQEVGAVSLYEGMVEKRGLSPVQRPDFAPEFSSLESQPPIALQKTFIFPHAVTALGTTVTAHGVTRTAVLFAYRGGQIVSVDRTWLDPRRPTGEATKAEKVERLVQYSPFLPVAPGAVITHSRVVEGLAKLYSEPTVVESTSLILGVGLDLFGTRVVPSRPFDLLSSEFNYSFLCIVVVALVVVAGMADRFVKQRALLAAWA